MMADFYYTTDDTQSESDSDLEKKRRNISRNRKMQTSNENGEICTVEKIVGRRITNEGQVEYKIKWQGYSSSYNSWEPSTTLLCQSLIDTFNKKIDKKFNICTQKYIVTTKSTLESSENSLIYPTSNDFENREAERVVGTSGVDSDSGEALLLVKWKDASLYGILKQSIVRQHFPQTDKMYFK